MRPIAHLHVIFLASSVFLLSFAAVYKIDKYENNTLLSIQPDYSKMFIKPSSFEKLRLKEDSWFNYYLDGSKLTRKVVAINDAAEGYEVVIRNNNIDQPVQSISYRIGKHSLFSAMFGDY